MNYIALGKIYHTITGRFKPTEKESVLGCLNTVAQSGNEQLIDVLNLVAGLGVREAWAREIVEQHAVCVRQTQNGNLRFEPDHSGEAISWRAGEQVLLPSCCQRCDSSPDEARTRCPILFGNRLEIERVKGGVELNGRRFRNVALDIGGGSLLEAFSLGRPGLDAVIIADPMRHQVTNLPISMFLHDCLKRGNYKDLSLAIEQDYGFEWLHSSEKRKALYREATLVFYETHSLFPFKRMFTEQYLFSAHHYGLRRAA